MKKLTWLSLLLVLVLGISAIASASVYGGREQREALRLAKIGDPSQARGDIGGVFTAALNATQPVYYTYAWDHNFFKLGKPLGAQAASGLWVYANVGSLFTLSTTGS